VRERESERVNVSDGGEESDGRARFGCIAAADSRIAVAAATAAPPPSIVVRLPRLELSQSRNTRKRKTQSRMLLRNEIAAPSPPISVNRAQQCTERNHNRSPITSVIF